ncbi:MAG: polysaccharide deacetylase family protein [Labilithrix sp.]|nr:polysaccharide deacetylase family protein [Labilithrix sp.]MCW5831254.1 polysaccharide deacetylase family protein [Labilithrix sp.]
MSPARVVFFAATLGGIGLTAYAVTTAPPPLWAAVAAVGLYVGIVLAGVFVLRLRMFADAVVRGPEDARGVVLTFDDGPDPVHTRQVLDILDEHDAKATFFVIGRKVDEHPDTVKEIVARGHEVGVHGWAHDRLFALRGPRRVRRDLVRAIRSLEKVTKRRPTLFRPPIGHTNPTIARIAEQLDLTVVGWSVAGYDGLARADPKKVAARITRRLDDGAIVLLHDAAERGDHAPTAAKTLPEILAAAKEKNLRVARLADWLAALEA